jgi:hypothetical protein
MNNEVLVVINWSNYTGPKTERETEVTQCIYYSKWNKEKKEFPETELTFNAANAKTSNWTQSWAHSSYRCPYNLHS